MKSFKVCFKALCSDFKIVSGRVLVCTSLLICEVLASMAFVWVSKRVVDTATGNIDADLRSGIILMASIVALQVVLRIIPRYYQGFIQIKSCNEFRADAFKKAMRTEMGGRQDFHSADIVNRLEEDITSVADFLVSNIPQIAATCTQFLLAVIYLFTLAPELGWVLVWIMPVAVLGSRLFFRKMRRLSTEIRSMDSKVQGHMQENLQNKILVRTLGAGQNVDDTMDSLQDELKGKSVQKLGYSAVSATFMKVGFSVGYMVAFGYGVFGLKNGTVTYGLMVAFLQLVNQVQIPVANLARHIPDFIKVLASEERLIELRDARKEPAEDDIVFSEVPGIRVKGLGFSYTPDTPVIDKLDFDFKPGSVTIITGPTGRGKSTLSYLMLALLKPDSGAVCIYDSTREMEVSPATRCNFMYVPQGNSLLSGTVRSNLLLADPSASDAQMYDALHTAAADFVRDLPDGLDTNCAEDGKGLSEGQAQRIAIARALLRPGGVLILDEACSALDENTERILLERLAEKFGSSKTVISITHHPDLFRIRGCETLDLNR